MRVLFLADSYRPARSACANRVAVLVKAMEDAGIDVQVLASSDSLLGEPNNYVAPNNVTYFKTFPLHEKTLINRIKNNFGGRRASMRAAKDMGDFDIVVCTTPPLILTASAIAIARAKHARLVFDVRDIWPDVAYEMGSFTSKSFYGRFFEHVACKAYEAADLVVSVSPGKVAKLATRVPGRRVVLVPNGIDESFLDNEENPALVTSLRLHEDPICAYVGNIGLAQGLGTLLDIAKVRPDVRFLLFGEGADRARLETRVRSEAIDNVEFCGSIDAQGVYTVLHHAVMSFVPLVSSRLRDSIPTKMYEALACGCPVLLAAEGDAANLLDECGLGAHAAPEDTEALLGAFDRLVEQAVLDRDRSAVSRWTVENHSRQTFASHFAREIEAMEGTCA